MTHAHISLFLVYTCTAGLALDGQKGVSLAFHTGVELDKSKTSSEHLRASATLLEQLVGVRQVLNKNAFSLASIKFRSGGSVRQHGMPAEIFSYTTSNSHSMSLIALRMTSIQYSWHWGTFYLLRKNHWVSLPTQTRRRAWSR